MSSGEPFRTSKARRVFESPFARSDFLQQDPLTDKDAETRSATAVPQCSIPESNVKTFETLIAPAQAEYNTTLKETGFKFVSFGEQRDMQTRKWKCDIAIQDCRGSERIKHDFTSTQTFDDFASKEHARARIETYKLATEWMRNAVSKSN